MRNRSDSSEVIQVGFRPERIAVTPEGNGCYCAQHGSGDLVRSQSPPKQKRPTASQNPRLHREANVIAARSVFLLPNAGDVEHAPLACELKAT